MKEGDKKVILVIDDDTDLLATVRDLLVYDGFDVLTAASGEEGLKILARQTADLIILDMSMPGMGGIAVLKRLSMMEHTAGIPVYVFTARANMQEFFENTEVAGFMSKPCSPNELLTDIRRILAEHEKSAAKVVEKEDAAPSRDRKGGRKLLLAEDEGEKRKTIVDALTADGYEVVTVRSGPEAVERAVAEKPDVAVLKLVLQNMNGDAVADMLGTLSKTKKVPVVVYDDTGSVPRGRRDADSHGAVRRFVKSASPDDIRVAVRSVLASQV